MWWPVTLSLLGAPVESYWLMYFQIRLVSAEICDINQTPLTLVKRFESNHGIKRYINTSHNLHIIVTPVKLEILYG